MPQVYLGGSQTNISRGASPLQAQAFLSAAEDSTIKRERADQALNKAVAFLNKYDPTGTSQITNQNGIVNSNLELSKKMRPQDDDKSRGSVTKLDVKTLKTSKGKTDEINQQSTTRLNSGNPITQGALGNANQNIAASSTGVGNQPLGKVADAALDSIVSKMGDPTATLQSKSLNKGENRSYNVQYTGPNITNAGDDYVKTLDSQQQFNDTFKKDTGSARMLAEFEEIGALASGRQYDPAKDVYLQGALARDEASNMAYANDAAREAAGTGLSVGGDGALSTGSIGVSGQVGFDAGTNMSFNNSSNYSGGGGGGVQKEDILYGTFPAEDGGVQVTSGFKRGFTQNGTSAYVSDRSYTFNPDTKKSLAFKKSMNGSGTDQEKYMSYLNSDLNGAKMISQSKDPAAYKKVFDDYEQGLIKYRGLSPKEAANERQMLGANMGRAGNVVVYNGQLIAAPRFFGKKKVEFVTAPHVEGNIMSIVIGAEQPGYFRDNPTVGEIKGR